MEQKPKYKRGEEVSALDNGAWRSALIVSDASWYHKGQCYGYEVCWVPLPKVDPVTGIHPSTGGWKSEAYLRK